MHKMYVVSLRIGGKREGKDPSDVMRLQQLDSCRLLLLFLPETSTDATRHYTALLIPYKDHLLISCLLAHTVTAHLLISDMALMALMALQQVAARRCVKTCSGSAATGPPGESGEAFAMLHMSTCVLGSALRGPCRRSDPPLATRPRRAMTTGGCRVQRKFQCKTAYFPQARVRCCGGWEGCAAHAGDAAPRK